MDQRTKGDLKVGALTLSIAIPVVIIVITIIFQLAK